MRLIMAGKEWLDFLSRTARNRFGGGSHIRGCAVLIDGDNAPPRATGALMHYASTLGRIEVCELFANFASTANTGWAVQMREHGMRGFQHYQTTAGKNAADIALVVRAMDLVHTKRIDHYMIVSSDADYAALAQRLRRSGASVHGVGSGSAPASLRQSCTSYLTFGEVDDLAQSSGRVVHGELWSRPTSDAEDLVLHALIRLGGARTWVSMTALGQEVRRVVPSFDPRSYSVRSMSELCNAIESVELDRSPPEPRARISLSSRNGSIRGPVSKS
jgi:uncharacterized LabA/DUF88 family protein